MRNNPDTRSILRRLTRVSAFFLFSLVFIVLAIATKSILSADAATKTKIPTAITDMESHAEDIYDTIYAKDWTKATSEYRWFQGGLHRLDTTVQGQQTAKNAIHMQVRALGTAIQQKKRHEGLLAANQTSLLATQMTAPYHPVVPIAIARLDYDGRELQIWAAANNIKKLRATAADIRKIWGQVRPQVLQHGGSTQAKRFDQLVARLGQAKNAADYARLATTILDEVDNLEGVFTK